MRIDNSATPFRIACCVFTALCSSSMLALGASEPTSSVAQTQASTAEVSGGLAAVTLGFEDGTEGAIPSNWFVPVQGWKAELVASKGIAGENFAKLTPSGTGDAPFGNLMRTLDATPYRGRHVKLSASIRVEGESGARAQMWLRADLANGTTGAFDNMQGRPIKPAAWKRDLDDPTKGWKPAVIEVDVEHDAARLSVGFMAFEGATVLVDSVTLEAIGPPLPFIAPQEPSAPRELSPRALENLAAAARLLAYVRFFVPSTEAQSVKAWDHVAVELVDAAEPAHDAADLAARLERFFAPFAPTLAVWAGDAKRAPLEPPAPQGAEALVSWRHYGAGNIGSTIRSAYSSELAREDLPPAIDGARDRALHQSFLVKELPGGVSCRIPYRMCSDDKRTQPPASAAMTTDLSDPKLLPKLTALNRSTRLAGVMLAWGVFQHFYPYFDVVKTDWDAALTAALARAATDADERAYLATLRELIAKLHDGHGGVSGPGMRLDTVLPLSFTWAGKDLVVIGKTGSLPDVKIGDVVVGIDGRDVEECNRDLAQRISGATDQWKRRGALTAFAYDLATADPARMYLRSPDGTGHDVEIARASMAQAAGYAQWPLQRPKNGAELAPGILYFDLNGTPQAALDAVMPALAAADGLVFDLRGYPNSAAMELMLHLIDEPATSARWNVPIVTLPDREGWTWNESGRWDLHPKEPRLRAKVAFITDGRAISYAESIMGIVEAYKMGEIVGATTAGTNGNVNPFTLPGGYSVSWTGMKVLKHDGSQHHGVGIKPTVPVEPTAKGIAEGRDEVLEKAVGVVQGMVGTGTASPR